MPNQANKSKDQSGIVKKKKSPTVPGAPKKGTAVLQNIVAATTAKVPREAILKEEAKRYLTGAPTID